MVLKEWAEERMRQALKVRRTKGTIRRLQASSSHCTMASGEDPIDFSSNDYLGLAHDLEQNQLVERRYEEVLSSAPSGSAVLGATGSRLLSGDAPMFHKLEDDLARIHNRPSALLCNSGYDANLTVVSCLPCDVIVYDEYAHNSLHMGMRLWQTAQSAKGSEATRRSFPFAHNNTDHLKRVLCKIKDESPASRVVVLIESVYSMDGDIAHVKRILDVAASLGARVIVDEAHGLGIYGRNAQQANRELLPGTGVVAAENVEDHRALLCSVHTFGKAAGCHGAVLCFASPIHKEYTINYGYPLIYSTALPTHSLVAIRSAYDTMTSAKGDLLRKALFELVQFFRARLQPFLRHSNAVYLLPSTSPIQALIVPGNDRCTRFCQNLWEASGRRIRLFPIKSPTVPVGQERVRIIIHAHNTRSQVKLLVRLLVQCLGDMALLPPKSRL